VYFETPLDVAVSKDFLMQNFAMKILNFEPQIYSRAEKLYNHIGKKNIRERRQSFWDRGSFVLLWKWHPRPQITLMKCDWNESALDL
jgi:hypothetical protein